MRATSGTLVADADGFTLIELICVLAIIAILSVIAVPGLFRAKISSNEASAIGSLRAINTAQSAYAASAASGGFASQLSVLAQACPGSSQAFVAADLMQDPSTKHGYAITLSPGAAGQGPQDCNGVVSYQGYYVTAVPVALGRTGQRAYATSPRAVIFFDSGGVAPTEADMAANGGGQALQ